MLSFSFSAAKMKKADMARARGHNLREHQTLSQLPATAWFSEEPTQRIVRWRDSVAESAVALAKRKDAVVGIELVLQVGNQSDWREPPSKPWPYGRPRRPAPADLTAAAAAVKKWLIEEFGKENVVSLDLHLDESTPHFHAVVVPIVNGKLNAKKWLDGPAKLAELWRRSHAAVNSLVPCSYTPRSGRGGQPHDPGQRAGSKPAGLLYGIASIPGLMSENARLKKRVKELEQAGFASQKRKFLGVKVREAQSIKDELVRAKTELKIAKLSASDALRERDMTRDRSRAIDDENKRLKSVMQRVNALGGIDAVEAKLKPRERDEETKKPRFNAPRL